MITPECDTSQGELRDENIVDGICPDGSIHDGLDDWPRSATRKEWFRITRELFASTIADMDLDPAALAEVEKAFIRAGLLV